MSPIKAIGFDLFNTLVTAKARTLDEAMGRLTSSLERSGLALQGDAFTRAYRDSALGYLEEANKSGRETHNRFWIHAALKAQGYDLRPEDPRIAWAVDAYFSAFFESVRLIPATMSMLETLRGEYRLGLLSNFTHAPAARQIIGRLGITGFFDVVLISGEVGYRKPHPDVFRRLVEGLGVAKKDILYVGDDPELDIMGARRAGLQPVWTTYVRDQQLEVPAGFVTDGGPKSEFSVPKISTWQDLFSLLDGK